MKVGICTPTITKPHPAYIAAMDASGPALDAAGIEFGMVFEEGNPYISAARATMLRKALNAACDVIVFIDHDLSWPADALVRLIDTEGEVAAGLYRFKIPAEEYMGSIGTAFVDGHERPVVRQSDGAMRGHRIPGGFLKITREGVERFMRAYPELSYGSPIAPHTDLFNHGAHEGVWYGEDYAFSRRWIDCGGEIWIAPDLDLTHHSADAAYPGNYHDFMTRRPGGSREGLPAKWDASAIPSET